MTNRGDNNDVLTGSNIHLGPPTQLEALTAQMKHNGEILAQLEAENASLRGENTSLITDDRSTSVDDNTRF